MKLRFRGNSMRLRVNQKELEKLVTGQELIEKVDFGTTSLVYSLRASANTRGTAEFDGKRIHVSAPLRGWARGDEIGFYFVVEAGLKVAIEKDLECLDGPEEEKDPDAFPRSMKAC
jgi:hypothetical protein